jgi:hypothetical protein
MNNTSGALEIVNSAYTTTIFSVDDSGNLSVAGSVSGTPVGGTTSSTLLGYIGMPQNSQSANYTLALSDQGKHVYVTATSTVTVPANSATAFPVGSTIAIIAGGSATVTISITTDTMYLGGSGTTGSRTLAAYGMATLVKVASTTWFISGAGLT